MSRSTVISVIQDFLFLFNEKMLYCGSISTTGFFKELLGCVTSACQASEPEATVWALAHWACKVQSPSAPRSTLQAGRPARNEIQNQVSPVCFLFK